MALFTGLAAWMIVAAGTGVAPGVALILLALCAFLFARAASAASGWELPLGIAAGGVAVALAGGETLLENTASPMGYANATAGFYALTTAAALIVVARCPLRPVRIAAGTLAVAFAAVPVGNGSRAGVVLVALLPLGFLGRLGPQHTRRLVVAGVVAVPVVVALTALWGANYDRDGAGGRVEHAALSALSERRAVLWGDAVAMIRDDPLLGAGPGSFAGTSPAALADPDARWAHSAYLQLGAETGLPGLALLLAIVGWGFALLSTSRLDSGAAIAAMALTGAAIHAAIDYVWDFPVLPLTLVLLVAAGGTRGYAR